MRVVLDTNILVRAFAAPQGPAGELFERIAADHLLIVSLASLEELARVLAYDRVRRLHRQSQAAIGEFIESVESCSLVVPLPEPLPRVVTHDPDDDIVVATAVAGKVAAICTLNRHFRHEDVVRYCRKQGIEIVGDVELLGRLRSEDSGRGSG